MTAEERVRGACGRCAPCSLDALSNVAVVPRGTLTAGCITKWRFACAMLALIAHALSTWTCGTVRDAMMASQGAPSCVPADASAADQFGMPLAEEMVKMLRARMGVR